MILLVVPLFSLPQPCTLETVLRCAGSRSNTYNIGFQVRPLMCAVLFSLHTVEPCSVRVPREDQSGSRQADGTNSPGKHAIRREFFCESSRIDDKLSIGLVETLRQELLLCSIDVHAWHVVQPQCTKKKKSSPSWSERQRRPTKTSLQRKPPGTVPRCHTSSTRAQSG
jgi:hypothetical protein